jgi:hypothetical protein
MTVCTEAYNVCLSHCSFAHYGFAYLHSTSDQPCEMWCSSLALIHGSRVKRPLSACVSHLVATSVPHNKECISPVLTDLLSNCCPCGLSLILLMWRVWWAPNNASRWQMGFNLVFKGLIMYVNDDSHSSFSGLVVSMLASGTQVRGFKPGWSRRIFQATKILSMPSFGGEVKPSVLCCSFVACKRSVHLPWKSHMYTKLNRPFPRPFFPSSLTEVSHVVGCGVPLEMMGGTKSSGAQ